MIYILNNVMEHELYKKYNYTRHIESYLAEWKAHNFVFYISPFGKIGKRTKDVNLDKNLDNDTFKNWYWIFRFF